jgi:hypothetical protein
MKAGYCSPTGGHHARKHAAKHFKLNWVELDERHRLVLETHEEGKLSSDEYLVGWCPLRSESVIAMGSSRASVRVIRTDEELMIATTVSQFLVMEHNRGK